MINVLVSLPDLVSSNSIQCMLILTKMPYIYFRWEILVLQLSMIENYQSSQNMHKRETHENVPMIFLCRPTTQRTDISSSNYTYVQSTSVERVILSQFNEH